MFDKYYDNTHIESVTQRVTENVNITEKRAPTDESVRLLNEFKEKAESNIIESVIVNNNILKGCVVSILANPTDFNLKIYFKFNLNGKDFTGYVLKDRNVTNLKEEMIKTLYEQMSKEITLMLIKENYEQLGL